MPFGELLEKPFKRRRIVADIENRAHCLGRRRRRTAVDASVGQTARFRGDGDGVMLESARRQRALGVLEGGGRNGGATARHENI